MECPRIRRLFLGLQETRRLYCEKVMATISGSCFELINKIDSIATNVNLLRMDIWKVAEHVTVTKDNVGVLQRNVTDLQETVSCLQELTMLL
ncbi:hypothetical protein NDU88_003927 [Pleurodeles waltl]|uniref:Uncharacterized protein n=1 Tax=Pleurodeles waltl TaxID=8319 RepID=A0AAV7V248_PLEWA|nr:hypothetical protein NDU88_003927 [Pleurodeles waltl]